MPPRVRYQIQYEHYILEEYRMIRSASPILRVLICLLVAASFITACAAPAAIATPTTEAGPPETLPPVASPVAFATMTPLPTAGAAPTTAPPTEAAPPAPADLSAFKNLAYRIPGLAQTFPETGGTVQLTDGVFDQPIPNSSASLHVQLLKGMGGDLNGDGVPDGAVVLLMDTGGSGRFIYLATLLDKNGQLANNATAFLGDRVRVENIAIDGSAVSLALIKHAPEDPQCCPTLQETAVYVLMGDMLVPGGMVEAATQAVKGVQALRDKDMAALAALAHPSAGIRFSPYATVKSEDLVFTPDQVAKLMDDPTVYTWGAFDGSGEPIQMAYPDYHARFVYSSDFASPDQVSFNQRTGVSNSIDNSQEFYPGSVIVEFYMAPKDPQYGGMDWQSLRLVMVSEGGTWYIIGIIHDEWTI
jgi:hypothetical protein